MQFMEAINFDIHTEREARKGMKSVELELGLNSSLVLHLANMSVHNLCAIF